MIYIKCCLKIFQCLSGNAGRIVDMFHKNKFRYLSHSLSSMGSTVSMEMPLAKAYLKVSHIMAWIKSIILSKNQLYITRLIW